MDIINTTGGNCEAIDWHLQPNLHPRGCLLHLAKEIRSAVDIPTIAVGRIVDPFQAEQILEDGIADLLVWLGLTSQALSLLIKHVKGGLRR